MEQLNYTFGLVALSQCAGAAIGPPLAGQQVGILRKVLTYPAVHTYVARGRAARYRAGKNAAWVLTSAAQQRARVCVNGPQLSFRLIANTRISNSFSACLRSRPTFGLLHYNFDKHQPVFIARYQLCPSVFPSQAGVVSKRLDGSSWVSA